MAAHAGSRTCPLPRHQCCPCQSHSKMVEGARTHCFRWLTQSHGHVRNWRQCQLPDLVCIVCKASPAVVHDQTVVYIYPGRHGSCKCGWVFGVNKGAQGLQQAALQVGQACEMQGMTQAQHDEALSAHCERMHETACLKRQPHACASATAPATKQAAHDCDMATDTACMQPMRTDSALTQAQVGHVVGKVSPACLQSLELSGGVPL